MWKHVSSWLCGPRSTSRGLVFLVVLGVLMPGMPSASAAPAAKLSDGTPVRVRLLHPINNETSKIGEELQFVVERDVVGSGGVLIKRGTPVTGLIVDVRRPHWGFFHHQHGELAFRFNHTAAFDGQVITLRACSGKDGDNRVVVNRFRRHEFQWAGEADSFDAYVHGNYEW